MQAQGDQSATADVEIIDSDENEAQPKQAKKHSKKKKKKEHKHHKEKRMKTEDKVEAKVESKTEFTGKEDYYVDKRPCNSYFAIETLKKDDAARYRIHFHHIGTLTPEQWRLFHRRSTDKPKRYFTKFKTDKPKPTEGDVAEDEKESAKTHRLSEDEFTAKTKVLNKTLSANPKDIDTWLEYVRFQEHFYMKMSKIQLAERKMEILNKSLRDNAGNERLYREYIDILEQAYPSFEVSKFLDILIQKGS